MRVRAVPGRGSCELPAQITPCKKLDKCETFHMKSTNTSRLTEPAIRTVSMSGVSEAGCAYGLRYQFIHTDAGRAASRRSRQRYDCTVRALAMARQLPYDEAYDILAAAGRKCGRGFEFRKWIGTNAWATKISFPARKGEPRMNLATFAEQHPAGTYIVKVAKHVIAVRDGVVYDDFENAPDRCVYTAWRIEDGDV